MLSNLGPSLRVIILLESEKSCHPASAWKVAAVRLEMHPTTSNSISDVSCWTTSLLVFLPRVQPVGGQAEGVRGIEGVKGLESLQRHLDWDECNPRGCNPRGCRLVYSERESNFGQPIRFRHTISEPAIGCSFLSTLSNVPSHVFSAALHP